MNRARMNHARLMRLIAAYGADPSRWPAAQRAAAEALLQADPAAAAAFEASRRIDALIARQFAAQSGDDAAAERVIGALAAQSLPAQRSARFLRGWPSALLDVEFAPAWPRVAVLASVAIIGFLFGLAGSDPRLGERSPVMVVAAQGGASPDPVTIVFEPEPVTGLQP